MAVAAAPPASLSSQRLKAVQATLQENEQLWPAILVFLGALFLLTLFPFYPLLVAVLLALVCGAAAYYYPPGGTILGVLLALPAVAYQSPLFAWIYLLIISLTLFKAFDDWYLISYLAIIICAPFSPFPLSFFGGFVQFGLTLGALYGGSKRSILISVPAVFLILLLSTIWLTPNSAFMLTKSLESTYGPAMPALARNALPIPDIPDLVSSGMGGLSGLVSGQVIMSVGPAMGKVGDNAAKLLINDSALLQLAAWAATLFVIGLLPGILKGIHKQLMAGACIIFIPISHELIASAYGIPLPIEIWFYTGVTIVLLYLMEQGHLDIARERFVRRQEKAQKFGHFGVEDLSGSDGPANLEQIGGYDDVKRELREAIVTPLENKELAVTYGIKPPSGILLFGPPGTGKTFMMKALSKELNIGFYYVKCSDILSKWVGETEKNISEIFAIARKNGPCVLFFDEIDSLARSRASSGDDQASHRALTQLLVEMDSVPTHGPKRVIVMAATNVPQLLDPAIMRPGRFDKIIYMPLPDAAARAAILRVHASKVPVAADVDFKKLAAMTDRYSGADLANAVSEAIRLAAREAGAKNQIVPLSQKHLTSVLQYLKPSTKLSALDDYEQFRLDFERRVEQAPPEEDQAPQVRWDDVVGLEDTRRALIESIEMPLLHEDLLKEYKLKPAKGLLLFGPPGCGKTLIVRAASHELKAHFFSLSGADLSKSGGENALVMLKDTFNRAREQAPAVIFFDEIDSLAPSRHSYSSPILTQMLQEMDGIKELKNVMVVGATNKPTQIDAALLRPGRFDKILYIPPPDKPAREQILRKALAGLLPGLDYTRLAASSAGFSGADLVSLAQEFKTRLVRQKIRGETPALSSDEALEILKGRKPSIAREDLEEYDRFRQEFGERR
ncbi:VCP-like ATPase [uncultured archaeon]|nr:VCP-like ATPase [uncultured archaeon]